jgi:hypothetical protein
LFLTHFDPGSLFHCSSQPMYDAVFLLHTFS